MEMVDMVITRNPFLVTNQEVQTFLFQQPDLGQSFGLDLQLHPSWSSGGGAGRKKGKYILNMGRIWTLRPIMAHHLDPGSCCGMRLRSCIFVACLQLVVGSLVSYLLSSGRMHANIIFHSHMCVYIYIYMYPCDFCLFLAAAI